MSTTPRPRPVGVGPALALIDAIDNGRHGNVGLLAHMFGAQSLTDSVIELSRRMPTKAEIIDDFEALIHLHECGHQRFLFHRLHLRLLDRVFAWTQSLMLARDFVCEMVNHYADASPDVDDNRVPDAPEVFEYYFVKTGWTGEREHVRGLGYAATYLMAVLTMIEHLFYRRSSFQVFLKTGYKNSLALN